MTRSGRDLGVAGVTAVAGDITRPDVVRGPDDRRPHRLLRCTTRVHRLAQGFPPLVDGVIGGLRGTGIRLAVVDNLYGYGPTHGAPIREDLPLAATNRKGTARAEVAERSPGRASRGRHPGHLARGSDYFGPGGIDSLAGDRFFEPILAGRKVQLIGDPDAPTRSPTSPTSRVRSSSSLDTTRRSGRPGTCRRRRRSRCGDWPS